MNALRSCLRFLAASASLAATWNGAVRAEDMLRTGEPDARSPLCILVTDPLARELACACVAGIAQRRYEALTMVLERRLDRPCRYICGQSLAAYWGEDSPVHLIVGKHSDVVSQATELGRKVFPLASLTDLRGHTTFRGLFVVRSANPAQSLADLTGYRVLFGPASSAEKHGAALEALRDAGVGGFDAAVLETVPTCTDAANLLMTLPDDAKVAAVISDYAHVLLEGCGTIPSGSLRVVATTPPVPFVTVFATSDLACDLRDAIRTELVAAGQYSTMLRLLESKEGFKPFDAGGVEPTRRADWPDFRGCGRDGLVEHLPDTLEGLRTAWVAPLQHPGLGGIAATDRWVAVTDRTTEGDADCLKLLDAETGQLGLVATLRRPQGQRPDRALDYGESVRATPVFVDDHVIVLDAYGTLFACPLPQRGAPAAERTLDGLRTDSMIQGYELATWGITATPLVVDDRLVLNVCGADTTLLALRLGSLRPLWKGAGQGTGYASCIVGRFGGRTQIVGYQSDSLAGWDIDSGASLWRVRPALDGDYNVPTPVAVDTEHLLVATENNGMRLYQFDQQGIPSPEPVAANTKIMPDTVTPVAVGRFAYCTSEGALYRIDLKGGLSSDWSMRDAAFAAHLSLFANRAGTRLLVVTHGGELLLFDIAGPTPRLASRLEPFRSAPVEEIYSHPALVGNRLYVRAGNALHCLAF